MAEITDSELVIGLVTPLGTNTDYLVNVIQGSLTDYGYIAVVIKLSGEMKHLTMFFWAGIYVIDQVSVTKT